MMSLVDKENDANFANRLSGKVNTGVSKPRFGSMLAEVRKEIQVEDDNLLAIDFQADEVAGIVKEWVQENRDMQMAAELAKSLEEEEAANRRLDILRGESEALKVAVEEKRRLKAEAEAKIQADRENEMLAKKFVEDEEKEYQRQRAAMLYADEKLCRQLSEDCGADDKQSLKIDHSSESKSRDCDSKEERKDWDVSDNETEDEEEEEEFEEEEDDDECKAQDVQDEFGHHAEQIIQQLEHDFELARHFQRQLDLEAKKTKLQLEAKDEAYSRKLQVLEERRAFMAKKRTQMRPLFEEHIAKFDASSPTQINETLVAQLWDTADADVDNVQNALCLTLLLPNIANVSVKLLYNNEEDTQSAVSRHSKTNRLISLRKRNPVIRIDATRLVHNRSLATTENTHYVAEFQLDPNAGSNSRGRGRNKVGLKLSHRDIYYEYCSESGVLHVFVENILLNEAVYNNANNGVATQATAPTNNSSRPVSTTSKVAAPVKNLMLKQFQQGFLRVFGKSDTSSVSSKSSRK